MRKRAFLESQIAKDVKQAEAGTKVATLARGLWSTAPEPDLDGNPMTAQFFKCN